MKKNNLYISKSFLPRKIISVGEIVVYYDYSDKSCTRAEFEAWIEDAGARVKVCGMKDCSEDDITKFSLNSARGDGYCAQCKDCQKIKRPAVINKTSKKQDDQEVERFNKLMRLM